MTQKSELVVALESHQQAAMELLRIAAAASEQINSEELLYLQEERGMKHLRDSVANIEMGITAQVANAKDGANKPLFTNDTLRKAEVADRLQNLSVYKEANSKLGEAINAQAIREIHIKKLNRDHALAKLAYEGLVMGRRDR